MNVKKIVLITGAVCLLFAIVVDGFGGGNGLGTIIGSLALMMVSLFCGVMKASVKSRVAAAPPSAKPVSKTPIFAHVPGPGEPGYDPNYDPDDEKYWRRYY